MQHHQEIDAAGGGVGGVGVGCGSGSMSMMVIPSLQPLLLIGMHQCIDDVY